MFAYLVAFFGSVLGASFPKRFAIILIPLVAVYLLFLVGFRDGIGTDWDTYLTIYYQLQEVGLSPVVTDIGYGILNIVSGELGWGIYFVNVVCALILMVGVVRYAFWCRNLGFAFFIAVPYLVIVVGMGYTRQSAAIGLLLIALPFLYEGRRILFAVFVIIAALFHSPAIIFIIFLLFLQNRRTVLLGMVSVGVALLVLAILFGGVLLSRVALYTDGEMESKGAYLRLLVLLVSALIFMLSARFYRDALSIYEFRVLFLASLGAFFLFVLGLLYSTIADRYAIYLYFLQISVYSFLPFRRVMRVFGYGAVATGYTTLFFVWLLYSPYSLEYWLPYSNILLR